MSDDQQPQSTPSDDLWAPVTVPAEESAAHQQLQDAYQQTLTAAGYGQDQRERYIAESGLDPEYAACVWDEEVMPAAKAAGAIPEDPGSAEHATRDPGTPQSRST